MEENIIKEKELLTGHKPVPIEIIDKVKKSICKIIIKDKEKINYGSGFFMKIDNSKKYLITNHHNISSETINKDINLELYNLKMIKLNLYNHDIKYFPYPKDITIIEIKEQDEIYKDIELLEYDLNYKYGYQRYKNADVFTIGYPSGKNASCASGKIINIEDFEFDHSISTEKGSSGSPIILLNSNTSIIPVIGIHKLADRLKKLNCGTFIGEIFNIKENNNNSFIINNINNIKINKVDINDNKINKNNNNNNNLKYIINKKDKEDNKPNNYLNKNFNNNNNILKNNINKKDKEDNNKDNYLKKNFNNNNNIINNINDSGKNNYITSQFDIDENNINKKIRIINSYENYIKKHEYEKIIKDKMNENQIKFFKIRINNKLIPFNYFYIFTKTGIYNIKYSFKNNLTNANYLFCECEFLINIDLSNFNTEKIKKMNDLFRGCKSLTYINLSKVNTKNVIDMSNMFYGCKSLTFLNLSNLNTKKVTDISGMFYGCKSLTDLDLSIFNTEKVTNMAYMFNECESLINIDLSNFNTEKLINMSGMFKGCKSINNINLINFNTENVIDMSNMLRGCKFLTNIDLSNFNTKNVIDMSYMFSECESFKDLNLSNFNTEKVIKMNGIFRGCKSLTKLNLSNFNIGKIEHLGMFSFCKSLTEKNIIAKDKNIIKYFFTKY